MRTEHLSYTKEEIIWGFRFWWKVNRYGVNSGEIRNIIKNHIKSLRRIK